MLVLKRWLHAWYLAMVRDLDKATGIATVHVQGDSPEKDTSIAVAALIQQEYIECPPPRGWFAQPNDFVAVYLADVAFAALLRDHRLLLVGTVVANIPDHDAAMLDVVLPGSDSTVRRCQLGLGYLSPLTPTEFQSYKQRLGQLDVFVQSMDSPVKTSG
ncbi:hypothetical protein ACHHYP_14476 [Achlya hypogyna]|uniref:Uncharacterized protein n=1 Tax=Achlya hypogyna TaxID=1202772 RepID=A0A1V9YD39_ACHHY|nr:hypothetical protein ACHHYP_14476 [Achlya hypogyna]